MRDRVRGAVPPANRPCAPAGILVYHAASGVPRSAAFLQGIPAMSLTHAPVRALGGVVASAHPLASSAGAEMLQAGGTAFDAVVATAATLNVVEPFMSGLAGLGMATFWDASERRVRSLDFTPPVPAGFDPTGVSRDSIVTGPMASGVPGNLAGWCALHETGGSLPLSRVLEPAIRHARNGFPLSALYCHLARETAPNASGAEWHRVYRPTGSEPRQEDILRQPDLASTLEAIAADGPGHLYGGPLGSAMVEHLGQHGGCLSMQDLEAVRPEFEDPLSAGYRGLVAHVPPPPCEAFQFLLTLRILDGFDLGALEHLGANHLDLVLRSIRLAAETRIMNNNRSRAEIQALLGEGEVAALRERVSDPRPVDGRTEQFGDAPPPEVADARGHTTSMSVADRFGNMVCITQSLGSQWGSTVVIPGTGVCMNNFMNWGDLSPASPNYLVGGRRWAMCLSPVICTRDGLATLAIGTPGSYGIMQTQAQAMVHHVDFGLNIREAIEAPRARLFDGRRVVVENRVQDAVITALGDRGHEIERAAAGFTMLCGGMQAVVRDPATGALLGAADPRRDGSAVGV